MQSKTFVNHIINYALSLLFRNSILPWQGEENNAAPPRCRSKMEWLSARVSLFVCSRKGQSAPPVTIIPRLISRTSPKPIETSKVYKYRQLSSIQSRWSLPTVLQDSNAYGAGKGQAGGKSARAARICGPKATRSAQIAPK